MISKTKIDFLCYQIMLKNFAISLCILFLCVSSFVAQEIRVYDTFDKMEKEIFLNNDTTYIINFWATWCKPCVKELPYFEKLNNKVADQKIKVILVSLDFKNQVDSKLKPFIEIGNYKSKIVLLEDNKYNTWIEKVNRNWSGSIPATLLIKGNNRIFAEQEFESEEELSEFVFTFTNLK